MNRGRAYREAKKLCDQYPVRYSEDKRTVVIERYDFPEGWKPRFGKLRYDLPSTYPRDMPTVYIPDGMKYRGGTPTHLLTFVKAPGRDGGEWRKWCIEDQNIPWDRENDSLIKLTTLMRASLERPNSDNPFVEAQ